MQYQLSIFVPLLLLCISLCRESKAQCLPVITGDTVLCPNDTGQLASTAMYDSYQWYKRSWGSSTASPIAGATNQTLTVSNNDVLHFFSLVVTQGACVDTSAEKLLDQRTFLPITVATYGDFSVGSMGQAFICEGDTAFYVLSMPYDDNIAWYRNGSLIPAANSDTLVVTQGGNYTVQAAPSLCPHLVQTLGLGMTSLQNDTAQITQNNNLLEVSNAVNWLSFQWYLNGSLLVDSTNSFIYPSSNGVYTVSTTNANGCDALSDGYNFSISNLEQIEQASAVRLYPNPFRRHTRLEWKGLRATHLRICDVYGNPIKDLSVDGKEHVFISLEDLPKGSYFYRLFDRKQLLASGKMQAY